LDSSHAQRAVQSAILRAGAAQYGPTLDNIAKRLGGEDDGWELS
jgi:hypothetical protein